MWLAIPKFAKKLKTLSLQDAGQDIVEYALLAGMIGLAVTASFKSFAQVLLTVFNNIVTALSSTIT
jgi:Flp pilus assembly pilin Flp